MRVLTAEDSDFSVRAQEIFDAKVIINENLTYHLKRIIFLI